MAKDVNSAQSIAEEDVNAQVVQEQSVDSQVATDDKSPASEKQAQDDVNEAKIPRSRLNEEIAKTKAAEQQAQLMQDQVTLMQTSQVQTTQVQQPKTAYEQSIAALGYDPDYLTEVERGKVLAHMVETMNTQNSQGAQVLANQQFINEHPDYNEAVGKQVGNQFLPSAEIAEILLRKPHLKAAAYASSQGAYQIVIDERKLKELEEKTAVNDEHLKQNDIDNQTAPVSGAAAGGGAIEASAGAVSIEQQLAMEQRVEGGEFNN